MCDRAGRSFGMNRTAMAWLPDGPGAIFPPSLSRAGSTGLGLELPPREGLSGSLH